MMNAPIIPHSFAVADATARLALPGGPGDVGKVCRQIDTGAYWRLASHSPAKWERVPRPAPAPPAWGIIWESPAIEIPAEDGAGIFYNEIVDLSPFGVMVDQDILQIDAAITKIVDGVEVSTHDALPRPNHYDDFFPDPVVAADVAIKGIGVDARPMIAAGGYPAQPGLDYVPDPIGGYGWNGVRGIETGNHHPGNECRYLRLIAGRFDDVWTPEETAIFANYRLRFVLTAPVQTVKTWEFPIPAPKGSIIFDQVLDLRDFGMDSGLDSFTFVVEYLRDGKIIRDGEGFNGGGPFTFDPPTYPVAYQFQGYVDPVPGGSGIEYWKYDSNNTYLNGETKDRGTLLAQRLGMCTEDNRTVFRMRLWRPVDRVSEYDPQVVTWDANGPETYLNEWDGDVVPVPGGAKDGCTLRVRLLKATEKMRGFPPFRFTYSRPDVIDVNASLATERARIDAIESAAPTTAAQIADLQARAALRGPQTVEVTSNGAEDVINIVDYGHLYASAFSVRPIAWPAGAAFNPTIVDVGFVNLGAPPWTEHKFRITGITAGVKYAFDYTPA